MSLICSYESRVISFVYFLPRGEFTSCSAATVGGAYPGRRPQGILEENFDGTRLIIRDIVEYQRLAKESLTLKITQFFSSFEFGKYYGVSTQNQFHLYLLWSSSSNAHRRQNPSMSFPV
jgi:hypothetical protein